MWTVVAHVAFSPLCLIKVHSDRCLKGYAEAQFWAKRQCHTDFLTFEPDGAVRCDSLLITSTSLHWTVITSSSYVCVAVDYRMTFTKME